MNLIFRFAIATLVLSTLIHVDMGSAAVSGSLITQSKNLDVKQALKYSTVVLGKDCYGKSDFPHVSSHVPGTVNVVTRTICPGKFVTVQGTLYRKGWFIFRHSRSVYGSGTGKAQINVALPCTWKPGMKAVHYWFAGAHQAAGSYMGATGGQADLFC